MSLPDVSEDLDEVYWQLATYVRDIHTGVDARRLRIFLDVPGLPGAFVQAMAVA